MNQTDFGSLMQILFFIILLWFIAKAFFSRKTNHNSSHIILWLVIFMSLIILYAFRFELELVKHKVLAVLIPNYSWTNEEGNLVLAKHQNGHFYVNAYTKDNQKIYFLIDTGASDIALTKKDALKLGFDLSNLKYTRQYSTANGVSFAAPVRIPELRVGEKTFYNIEGHISSGELDISLLGMSLIENFKDFKITNDLLILNY